MPLQYFAQNYKGQIFRVLRIVNSFFGGLMFFAGIVVGNTALLICGVAMPLLSILSAYEYSKEERCRE